MPVRVGALKLDLKGSVKDLLAKHGQRCAQKIAARAPVGTSGEYRDFWKWEFDGDDKVVIFNNGPHRSLTHLLEKGHVVQKSDGSHGWSPAEPHIRPAFEETKKEFLEDLRNIEIAPK